MAAAAPVTTHCARHGHDDDHYDDYDDHVGNAGVAGNAGDVAGVGHMGDMGDDMGDIVDIGRGHPDIFGTAEEQRGQRGQQGQQGPDYDDLNRFAVRFGYELSDMHAKKHSIEDLVDHRLRRLEEAKRFIPLVQDAIARCDAYIAAVESNPLLAVRRKDLVYWRERRERLSLWLPIMTSGYHLDAFRRTVNPYVVAAQTRAMAQDRNDARSARSADRALRVSFLEYVRPNYDKEITEHIKRSGLRDEFRTVFYDRPSSMPVVSRDVCVRCQRVMELNLTNSKMTCPSCGYSYLYVDTTSATVSFGEEVSYSANSYSRIGYFSEKLKKLHAKHKVSLTQWEYDILCAAYYKWYGITHLADITIERTREILSTLRWKHLYRYQIDITDMLAGRLAIPCTREFGQVSKFLFKAIEPYYDSMIIESAAGNTALQKKQAAAAEQSGDLKSAAGAGAKRKSNNSGDMGENSADDDGDDGDNGAGASAAAKKKKEEETEGINFPTVRITQMMFAIVTGYYEHLPQLPLLKDPAKNKRWVNKFKKIVSGSALNWEAPDMEYVNDCIEGIKAGVDAIYADWAQVMANKHGITMGHRVNPSLVCLKEKKKKKKARRAPTKERKRAHKRKRADVELQLDEARQAAASRRRLTIEAAAAVADPVSTAAATAALARRRAGQPKSGPVQFPFFVLNDLTAPPVKHSQGPEVAEGASKQEAQNQNTVTKPTKAKQPAKTAKTRKRKRSSKKAAKAPALRSSQVTLTTFAGFEPPSKRRRRPVDGPTPLEDAATVLPPKKQAPVPSRPKQAAWPRRCMS